MISWFWLNYLQPAYKDRNEIDLLWLAGKVLRKAGLISSLVEELVAWRCCEDVLRMASWVGDNTVSIVAARLSQLDFSF